MKLLAKRDIRVTFILRVIFVYLILNISLWISPKGMVFSAKNSLKDPVAIIISVTDLVEIRKKDETIPIKAEQGAFLYEGDTITTGDPAHITLFHYLHENLIRIPKNKKNIKITRDLPEQGKLAELKYILKATYVGIKSSLFPQPVLSSPGAVRKWRLLKEAEIVDLLTPVATKVMIRYPHFIWLPLQGIKKYEIIIFDGLGHVLWRHETIKTEIDYPKDAPILIPGEYYFWQVKGVDESYSESDRRKNLYLTLGITYFTVMHKEEIEEIKKEIKEAKQIIGSTQDEIFNLLLGIYYEKKQLYPEAQEEYEKLVRLNPANNIYKNILANLYIKIGRKWAAADLLQE